MRRRREVAAVLALASAVMLAGGDARAQEMGPCSSPRRAMETLLTWLQPERNDAVRAARCLDRSGMDDPASEAPDLAVRLKKVLDGKGLYVDLDAVPDEADYRNPAGAAEYEFFPHQLGGIKVVLKDKRWVFPASSLRRVPDLYAATYPAGLGDLAAGLPDWLRVPVLGVEAWKYAGVVLLIFIALLLQRLVVHAFGTYLHRIAGRLGSRWLDGIVRRADRPVGGLVMAAVFFAGFPLLEFSVRVNQIVLFATRVLAAFSIVWLGYRLVDVLAEFLAGKATRTDTKLDDQLVPLVRKTLKLLMVVIGGLFILQNLDVDIGSLLAGVGLGGLAFALAAKDTVANFFGSVMIFTDRPFQIGDWVRIGSDIEGTVEEVGFRSTRIRTFYNSLVTVPNARLVDSMVDNLGARRYRRYKTTLSLTYDTPPEKVQAFCEGVRAIIQAMPGMRKDFYLVEFLDFGAHSLDVLLYCFMDVPDWATELRTRTYLNLEILRLAQALGVEFAFPTQTLHVASLPPQSGAAVREAAPPDPTGMAEVVQAFGPRGRLSRVRGVRITSGFDPGDRSESRGDNKND